MYYFNYLSSTICILAVLSNYQIWRNAQTQVGLLANCRQYGGVGVDCGLHPLIHTLLEFDLVKDVAVSKPFADLGSKALQTGHALSFRKTMMVSLH